MCARRVVTTNNGTIYVIVVAIIIIAFLLLGGWQWLQEAIHGNYSLRMSNWNWPQILISLGIGCILGVLIARNKR